MCRFFGASKEHETDRAGDRSPSDRSRSEHDDGDRRKEKRKSKKRKRKSDRKKHRRSIKSEASSGGEQGSADEGNSSGEDEVNIKSMQNTPSISGNTFVALRDARIVGNLKLN